ncbi:MAG: AURKAIP1/COX24 domain-containing protein [Anaerolineae bacterium]|nr:AURKAIP1/COX24 domain-containing protein [Anaerolineae bacterium]
MGSVKKWRKKKIAKHKHKKRLKKTRWQRRRKK